MARHSHFSIKLSRATLCAALSVSALPGCRRAPDSESLLVEAQQPEIIALRGHAHLAVGDTEQARSLFEQILKKQPDQAGALVEQALAKSPDHIDSLRLKGDLLRRRKNNDGAREAYTRILRLRPDHTRARIDLANMDIEVGNCSRARSEIEVASKIAPNNVLVIQQSDNPLGHNLKGGVLLAREDRAGARGSFQKALSLDPAYVSAMENLAQLDMAEKKPEQARHRFEAALAGDPKNARLMTSLSKLAAAIGKQAEALRYLERAHQENPEALTPAILLSNAYLKVGEKQKALLKKAAELAPKVTEISYHLGAVQAKSGDKKAARAHLEHLFAHNKDFPNRAMPKPC